MLVTCLLSPPLNHGLRIPLQTISPWLQHNFPHKQYQNCCGCSAQELTPKKQWAPTASVPISRHWKYVMPQNIKTGCLGWAGWASADPTPKKAADLWKKPPKEAGMPRSISDCLCQRPQGAGKYSSSACSFHWETQSSTPLCLKQITKENFIYFYWTGIAEQKTLHWCLPSHLVFDPYGIRRIFKAGVGLDPKQSNMFPQGLGCYGSCPYSHNQLQLPSVPQKTASHSIQPIVTGKTATAALAQLSKYYWKSSKACISMPEKIPTFILWARNKSHSIAKTHLPGDPPAFINLSKTSPVFQMQTFLEARNRYRCKASMP